MIMIDSCGYVHAPSSSAMSLLLFLVEIHKIVQVIRSIALKLDSFNSVPLR